MEKSKLVQAFKIECRGADIKGNYMLTNSNSETAIVKIFDDGDSRVLCRYREGMRCNLAAKPDTRDNGICHYYFQ